MRTLHSALVAPLPRRRAGCALGVLAAAVLTACGGGGSSSDTSPDVTPTTAVAVSGVVADGPIHGAIVCYDLNDNGQCDSGEPQGATDDNGRYQFEIDTTVAGQHGVVAQVPATAIDKDTGQPVGTAFTLKSPPSGSAGTQEVFVSPLTTLVVEVAASQGLSTADATASVQQQLGLTASPMANFVAAGDSQSATMAKTINTVIVTVTAMADTAGVDSAAKKALVASVVSSDLSTLATLVNSATGSTPADIAAQVTSTVLTDRNLTPTTVAEHAATAVAVAAPQPASTTGPFVSVRRFTFSDGANYRYQAFVGDNTPGADGTFVASEMRAQVIGGVGQPFNRNTVYWNKTSQAWEVCALEWQVVRTKPQSATSPQESLYCGGSKSTTLIAETDISGRSMAEVVSQARGSSLRDVPGYDTDATGLPTLWGPPPTALGSSTFPEGSRITRREQTTEVGDTDRYGLTDKPRVAPAYKHAATLEGLGTMNGDLVSASTVPGNANTVFVDDLPATPTDPTLRKIKRYRAALSVDVGTIRFYACDIVDTSGAAINCTTEGTGTTAISTQGDARVMRVTSGYPAALTTGAKRVRTFVQRSGVVFGGYRDLERKSYHQRLNTTAWNAMRTVLGVPEVPTPTAPVTSGPFEILRSFTFLDSGNFATRISRGDSSAVDAQGNYSVDDLRFIKSAGVEQPFNRNTLYWTGTEWYDCPSTGLGVITVSSTAPFTSTFCKTYVDDRLNNVTVTLAGRLMSDVVQDIRWYPTKDGNFDYVNWGPSPAHTDLVGKTFPAGATMEYRGNLRRATPLWFLPSGNSQRRVPPADPSVPFNTWPYATTLEEWIGKYPGDINGGPLNGSTADSFQSVTLPTPPSPEYTTLVEYRVAFDPNGQKVRFYRNNRSATTGFTTNYVKLLDTTYTIDAVGDARVLRFAEMPAGFEAEFNQVRIFVQRNGGVWFGGKDSIPADGRTYNIRLNKTAKDALATALGIN